MTNIANNILPGANDPKALRQTACTELVERVLDHMHAQRITLPKSYRDSSAQVSR
jgi:hypothetical protein